MRKALVLTSILATTLLSAPAFAQERKIGLGGDLQFVIPIGDMSDYTGPQIGPIFHFGYMVIPQLEITGRTGYLFGTSHNNVKLSDFPIWGGVRYFFLADQSPAGPYVAGEAGFNFLNSSFSRDVPGVGTVSDSNGLTRFGLNLGGGYVISKELPIDLRGQFMFENLIGKGDEKTLIGLGLSVGYTYQL